MFLLRPTDLLRHGPFSERENVCNSQENGVRTKCAAIVNHRAIVTILRVVNLLRAVFLVRRGPWGWCYEFPCSSLRIFSGYFNLAVYRTFLGPKRAFDRTFWGSIEPSGGFDRTFLGQSSMSGRRFKIPSIFWSFPRISRVRQSRKSSLRIFSGYF